MKIAYIVDSIIPSHTANSIHVMKMAEAFKRNGEDVTLIAPSFSNRDESKDSNDIYGIKDRFEIVWIPFGRGILFYPIMPCYIDTYANQPIQQPLTP